MSTDARRKTLAIFEVGATRWCEGDKTSNDEKRRREERTSKRGECGRRVDASSGEREREAEREGENIGEPETATDITASTPSSSDSGAESRLQGVVA